MWDSVRHTLVAAACVMASLVLSGCASVAFVGQAANGQAEVMRKARLFDEVITDPTTAPELADKLKLAQTLRRFAIERLKLPENASYTRYADLGRPYALWNVVSTPPLSFKPIESCFPIAGCLAYRGYYREDEATAYANSRRALGEDVYLYGVPAYSTLGWFADPLLNTTARYDAGSLARLIFHELAHQVVYVKGDSAFNEAFATAVELEGYALWIAASGDDKQLQQHEYNEKRRAAFREMMAGAKQQLGSIYRSGMPDDDKRVAKAAALTQLAADYQTLKTQWRGFVGYDAWFQPTPNNGHFVSMATYYGLVPAFRQLFAQSGRDWNVFYDAVKTLAQKNEAAREESLAALNSAVVSGEKQRGTTHDGIAP